MDERTYQLDTSLQRVFNMLHLIGTCWLAHTVSPPSWHGIFVGITIAASCLAGWSIGKHMWLLTHTPE
jgi:hypothetical protein